MAKYCVTHQFWHTADPPEAVHKNAGHMKFHKHDGTFSGARLAVAGMLRERHQYDAGGPHLRVPGLSWARPSVSRESYNFYQLVVE